MSEIKTKDQEINLDNLDIYNKILSNRKVTINNNTKQGMLFTTWALNYFEENNFLDILGIDYQVNKNNIRKLYLDISANILNYHDLITDPEIFNKFFNKEIQSIHFENILYKRNDEYLYLDINFNSVSNKYMIITVNDNSDSLEAQLILEELVNDNQILIKEVHHRVKNNLQILLSLISIQERFKKTDYTIKEYLKLSITSMAIMHSQLYSENFTYVSTKRILMDLKSKCEGLYSSLNITFDFESKHDTEITLEKANPILLLLDELIVTSVNSLESATEKIVTCVFTKEDNYLVILYKDNATNKKEDNSGLGDLLIESLISQADGIKDNPEGTGFDYKIKIPLN